jgi:hypothetical protein
MSKISGENLQIHLVRTYLRKGRKPSETTVTRRQTLTGSLHIYPFVSCIKIYTQPKYELKIEGLVRLSLL